MGTPDPDEGTEHADISRLLADARSADPIPPAVAARLDAVLAGLVDSREATRAPTPRPVAEIIPLRRRVLPKLLTAAAAIVILGGAAYGIDQIARSGTNSSSGSSAGSAASSGEASTAPRAHANQLVPGAPATVAGHVVALTTAHFKAGVTALLADPSVSGGRSARLGTAEVPATPPVAGSDSAGTACATPAGVSVAAGERTVAISLDGRPAVLVLHPVRNHQQVAQAYACTTPPASPSAGASPGGAPAVVTPLATATIAR